MMHGQDAHRPVRRDRREGSWPSDLHSGICTPSRVAVTLPTVLGGSRLESARRPLATCCSLDRPHGRAALPLDHPAWCAPREPARPPAPATAGHAPLPAPSYLRVSAGQVMHGAFPAPRSQSLLPDTAGRGGPAGSPVRSTPGSPTRRSAPGGAWSPSPALPSVPGGAWSPSPALPSVPGGARSPSPALPSVPGGARSPSPALPSVPGGARSPSPALPSAPVRDAEAGRRRDYRQRQRSYPA
jgi:hypothetical protein